LHPAKAEAKKGKSFLVLFFKKELLAFFTFAERRPPWVVVG
jgi:hypothetical protein